MRVSWALWATLARAAWPPDGEPSRTGAMLLDFYVPWCSECQALESQLASITTELSHPPAPVRVIRVDGEAEPDVVAQYGVSDYPELLLLLPGAREPLRYTSAELNAPQITQWVRSAQAAQYALPTVELPSSTLAAVTDASQRNETQRENESLELAALASAGPVHDGAAGGTAWMRDLANMLHDSPPPLPPPPPPQPASMSSAPTRPDNAIDATIASMRAAAQRAYETSADDANRRAVGAIAAQAAAQAAISRADETERAKRVEAASVLLAPALAATPALMRTAGFSDVARLVRRNVDELTQAELDSWRRLPWGERVPRVLGRLLSLRPEAEGVIARALSPAMRSPSPTAPSFTPALRAAAGGTTPSRWRSVGTGDTRGVVQ